MINRAQEPEPGCDSHLPIQDKLTKNCSHHNQKRKNIVSRDVTQIYYRRLEMRPSEGEALVSCDTFVVMADCSETGEVRERMSQTLSVVCSRPVSDLSIDFCR